MRSACNFNSRRPGEGRGRLTDKAQTPEVAPAFAGATV